MTRFTTMSDVRAANKAIGHHWFTSGAMRFFRSRVGTTLYGGRYFVSSEQFDNRSPRLYTIREARPDGSITTVGTFQEYESDDAARAAIKRLLSSKEVVTG